jgi:DNA-binding transcriptional ArsR family regulator
LTFLIGTEFGWRLTGKQSLTYNRGVRTVERLRADVFHAISDPTRRGLLAMLAEGERPVKSLADGFAMTRPAVSQHLRVLREAGLVGERRVGRERRYRLQAAPLREVGEWVAQFERFWVERLDALGRYLDRQAEREKES